MRNKSGAKGDQRPDRTMSCNADAEASKCRVNIPPATSLLLCLWPWCIIAKAGKRSLFLCSHEGADRCPHSTSGGTGVHAQVAGGAVQPDLM